MQHPSLDPPTSAAGVTASQGRVADWWPRPGFRVWRRGAAHTGRRSAQQVIVGVLGRRVVVWDVAPSEASSPRRRTRPRASVRPRRLRHGCRRRAGGRRPTRTGVRGGGRRVRCPRFGVEGRDGRCGPAGADAGAVVCLVVVTLALPHGQLPSTGGGPRRCSPRPCGGRVAPAAAPAGLGQTAAEAVGGGEPGVTLRDGGGPDGGASPAAAGGPPPAACPARPTSPLLDSFGRVACREIRPVGGSATPCPPPARRPRGGPWHRPVSCPFARRRPHCMPATRARAAAGHTHAPPAGGTVGAARRRVAAPSPRCDAANGRPSSPRGRRPLAATRTARPPDAAAARHRADQRPRASAGGPLSRPPADEAPPTAC